MPGIFKIQENWSIQLKDMFGEIIDQTNVSNLVTNIGLNVIRDLIGGLNAQEAMTAIAIGTGIISPVNGDTALETEFDREAATVSTPSDYQVRFSKTFTFGSGVSEDITEAGILDENITGGNLLARVTFAAKTVTSAVSLIVTATFTISRI